MTAKHFHNSTLNKHGVDVVTDNGGKFGIACPDERTARTLAAGVEAVRLLAEIVKCYENAQLPYSAIKNAQTLLNTLPA